MAIPVKTYQMSNKETGEVVIETPDFPGFHEAVAFSALNPSLYDMVALCEDGSRISLADKELYVIPHITTMPADVLTSIESAVEGVAPEFASGLIIKVRN